VEGGALIDVGGGVGAIQQSLIAAGVTHVVSVDASLGYSEAARQLAEQEGYADRVTRIHGDFTRIAPTLDPADVVTLDRVICCFDDMPALVGASASRAAHYWGAVFPRSFWWLRGGAVIVRAILVLIRFPMHFFVHKTEDVDAVLREHGLSESFRRNMGIWQVVIYGRG
jgi:magnesium-protoporphyrin O-methyltransferase